MLTLYQQAQNGLASARPLSRLRGHNRAFVAIVPFYLLPINLADVAHIKPVREAV